MKILVIGGTRFFGIHAVNELLKTGHDVTIATRGKAADNFADNVERIIVDRTNAENMKNVFIGRHYDVVIDNIAYCSNDIKCALENIDHDKYIFTSSTAVYEPKHLNTAESDFDGLLKKFIWCDRQKFPYDESKRQAERALWQEYPARN